jgi:TfoX/Sxy family transcriptional regulator of competence genes
MAYNSNIAEGIRHYLNHKNISNIEEKQMMGGLSFMVNSKMCVGVIKDELICRIDPAVYEQALEKNECRPMDFTGRPMKGWLYIDEIASQNSQMLAYWVQLALDFNSKAKISKKRKSS